MLSSQIVCRGLFFKISFGKRTQEFTNAFNIVFMNSKGQVKLR